MGKPTAEVGPKMTLMRTRISGLISPNSPRTSSPASNPAPGSARPLLLQARMKKFLSPEKTSTGGGIAAARTSDHPLDLVKDSVLYKEFLAEREEILRHKWLESEKAGHDIGFEKALLDWIVRHRSSWRERRKAAASARSESVVS